jgi:hypothetical protein
MSQTIGRGGTTGSQMDAYWYDGSRSLVSPTTPRVDVINPSDVVVVDDGVPTLVGLGQTRYPYTVPVDAPLGTWRYHWTGLINNAPVVGDESFVVVAAGTIETETPLLVPISEYRRITIDSVSTNTVISGALVEATGLVEEYLGRYLASTQRTEMLPMDSWGRVYPRAVPITAVATSGLVNRGHYLTGATGDEVTSFLIDWPAHSPVYSTVAYTGGFTEATLPRMIVRRICWEAYYILHAEPLADIPVDAPSAQIGDASVTFGPQGPQGPLTDDTRKMLRLWRKRAGV